tara:strand:+ start:379 stop:1023 length:645 start_codon:yes stop_codon:yes gene_type:complete
MAKKLDTGNATNLAWSTSSKPTIWKAMMDFRGKVDQVERTSKNEFLSYKYANINNIIDTIKPVLYELGMGYVQTVQYIDGVDLLNTRIYLVNHPEEFIESNIRLIMAKEDSQSLGSSITYNRRYALWSMFSLEVHDDDGERATQTKAKTQTQSWNEHINEIKGKIDKAKKDGDLDKANDIWEWLDDKTRNDNGDLIETSKYISMVDYYEQVFKK